MLAGQKDEGRCRRLPKRQARDGGPDRPRRDAKKADAVPEPRMAFGDRRLTSRDVAALAGVSQATVSRVLSGSDLVKESTRQAVLRALETTGYVVNVSARTMRSGRTGVIGVVVTHMTNPFYPELLEALSNAIHASNHRMILWDGRQDGEADAASAIRERAVDSVIFTTATPASRPLREALEQELPVVLVNRSLRGVRCDSVTTDNLAGSRAVARYFIDGGRNYVAAIGGLRGTSTADERLQGFKSGLAGTGKGGATLVATTSVDWSYEEGVRAFNEILESRTVPDAIFCANDVLAFGAMDAARARGFGIPDDIWFAGYDDIAIAGWGAYDLTTIRQPLRPMAEQAVNMALHRLAEPGRAPQRSRLTSELVVRGSTANYASSAVSAAS
ncbi:LacI family DNA-binding transcriptional regulator [Jatrophihabitans cynanchi]|uniref:LacI family DNA-binding transcriptional regulator n=1 Tax=Jatrophihabitans cynanchi TaxID=2944128 RepID=A0ABY7K0U9_9ACTN|nr:LacI family DNA-binding transcriptional regulator [Jatrophihabitans sp. SB3-54]WAX58481.1 LacI family DNA-binding transcriptional regulator [Jatrophihabitans sp. SB3-54]